MAKMYQFGQIPMAGIPNGAAGIYQPITMATGHKEKFYTVKWLYG
tara:strand:+ start:119038 stop:119172 length:135 start_codon:yes stop_codon:yes gene_type:complete